MSHITVSDAARRLSEESGQTVAPRDISDLFYRRLIPDDSAPVVGKQRLIPLDLLWLVKSKLEATGKLSKGAQHVG